MMKSKHTIAHIGIAVHSIEESFKFYKNLGFQGFHEEKVEKEGVRVACLEFANNISIELLEPLNEQSPIAKFLKTRGPGIHHVCLGVTGIGGIVEELKKQGVHLIYPEVREGANNCWINFVHPKSTSGVLLEISEKRG